MADSPAGASANDNTKSLSIGLFGRFEAYLGPMRLCIPCVV